MTKVLVVIGLQPEKVKCIRGGDKLVHWVRAHQKEYDVTMSVVRKDLGVNSQNFKRDRDKIGNQEMSLLNYESDQIIEVPGFDLDCSQFRTDAGICYYLMGISTGASILSTAFSMYSHGCNIKIMEKLCRDRKGMHREAIKIMKAYMPSIL